jgi:glycosyltransferase involved in cell wall biosynthesis
MKKIILLIDSSDFGGIESHLLQLSLLLQQKRRTFLVLFINSYHNLHPLAKSFTLMGIPFFYLCGSFCSLKQFLKKHKNVYLIHAHGYKATLWARLACLYYPIICLSTYHSGENCFGKVAFYQLLMYKTGFLSKNFAVSHSLAIKQKSIWIPNFTALPIKQDRTRHSRLQIGFVGRNDPVKGLDRFLCLSQKNMSVDWHVFGSHDVQDRVSFHGKVDSMENYWHKLDLLIIPSRQEGLPMAALEAMANQVPVFSTRVGELTLLLPENWTVDEPNWLYLTDKIMKIANSSDKEWNALSENARNIVENGYLSEDFWAKISPYYKVNGNAPSK